MANKKDVELVIRAKNEASKAVDAVTAALKEFSGTSDGIAKSSDKTDSALSRLGNEFRKLSSEVKGLSALDTAAKQIEKVAAAVSRLEGDFSKAAAESQKFAASFTAAAANTSKLEREVEKTTTALQAQKDATAAARKEQSAANAEMRKAESALSRYQQKSIAPGGATIKTAAQSAGVFLEGGAAQSRQAATDAAAAYAKQKSAQDETAASLKGLNAALRASRESQRQIGEASQRSAEQVDTLRQRLERERAVLAEISGRADAAGQALGGVAVSTQKVGEASARAAADLAKVNAALNQRTPMAEAPEKTLANYRAQIQAVQQSRQAWREAQGEANRLATAMRGVEAPTREMQTAFVLAQAASARARQEYAAQAGALNQLRGVTQGSFLAFSQAATAMRAASGSLANTQQQIGANAQAASIAQRNLAGSVQAAGQAMAGAGQSGNIFSNSLKNIYGDSRQALSLLQRLRGQVLSLAASYVGLQAAIGQGGGVVKAFQGLEAAQNRLGAVFNQDIGKVANEMQFLERQASRLGVQFGTLADEYGKFAIAASGANFQSEATRRIFLSVAEAGRVNKLSQDQLSGVFLALTQMISKGKVQSEELRRQLGDRLPGAFNLMAKAIGVTTAELDKMMQNGEVLANQSNLLKFAGALNDRFGGQLSESLQSVTTEMGKFSNEVYQAQLRVAEGGFIEAFRRALQTLNGFFQSREGRDFFLEIGAAAGKIVDVLVVLVRNFDLIGKAIQIFIAYKVAGFFQSLATNIRASAGATQLFSAQMTVAGSKLAVFMAQMTNAAIGQFTAAMTALRVQVTALGAGFTIAGARMAAMSTIMVGLRGVVAALAVGFRAFWVALGGPIGIITVGLTYIATELLGGMFSGIDKATQAMDEHKRILEEVVKGYDAAADKSKDWAKNIKNVSASEVAVNLYAQRKAFREAREEVDDYTKSWRTAFSTRGADAGQVKILEDLNKQFQAGQISAQKFREGVEKIFSEARNGETAQYAAGLSRVAKEAVEAEKRLGEAADLAEKFSVQTGKMDRAARDATGGMKNLTEAGKDLNNILDPSHMENYTKALDKFKEVLPDVKREMDRLNNIGDLSKTLERALQTPNLSPQQIQELRRTYDDAVAEINRSAASKSVTQGLVDRIAGAESGGNAAAKNPLSSATGLGQFIESTWTRMFQQYFPDRAAGLSREAILALRSDGEISRKMIELYASENAAILQKAGVAVTDTSLYLAHFLGPNGAQKVLNAAGNTPISELLSKAVVNANKEVLQGRSAGEVVEWAKKRIGVSDQELAVVKQIREEEQKRLDKQSEFQESFADRQAQRENELQALRESGREYTIQREVEKEIAAAKRAGVTLTEQQLNQVRQLTAAKYDEQHAEDELNRRREYARELMNEAVGLERQRTALMQQWRVAMSEGDTEEQSSIEERLRQINTELPLAVASAREFAAALGDQKMLGTLDNIDLRMKNLTLEVITAKQATDMLASGGANAFDRFSQGVANGEGVLSSLKDAFLSFASDFLRQIAQMIIQQAIFNALGGTGGAGGGIAGAVNGLFNLFHSGGIVGKGGGQKRRANPAWFANAPRYHSGGIAGLKPGEVPAILEKNEEVLTANDPRHSYNGGGAAGGSPNIKIVNAIDSGQFVSEGLNTEVGQESVINFIRNNSGAVKQALGTS